jgi:hypothetical protein
MPTFRPKIPSAILRFLYFDKELKIKENPALRLFLISLF